MRQRVKRQDKLKYLHRNVTKRSKNRDREKKGRLDAKVAGEGKQDSGEDVL